jgi:hypothetical protein
MSSHGRVKRDALKVPRVPLPAVAAVISFIDCINRGDVEGLGALMTIDHQLVVLDEPPLVGRAENIEAWRGYFSSYPHYVIYPRQIAARDNRVAVLGATTGSHLALPDEEEERLTLIWLASVEDGALASWQIREDTSESRERSGLIITN